MTLQLYLHTVTLLFFPPFNVFETIHTHSGKIIACSRVASCDSGPESESAKFYRLQFRLRLRPKRSTPIDSNSGLDSDSAALATAMTRKLVYENLGRGGGERFDPAFFVWAYWRGLITGLPEKWPPRSASPLFCPGPGWGLITGCFVPSRSTQLRKRMPSIPGIGFASLSGHISSDEASTPT